jgi:predicted sulfurtransferase
MVMKKKLPPAEDAISQLKETIQRLHGGIATHAETVAVKEVFNDKVIWQGDVEVFDLRGNPKATRAYAWMHGLDDTKAKRHVAVLHVPPVDSPQAAVKAVIVYEYRQQKK